MTIDHRLILKEVGDYVGITLGLLLYTIGFTAFLMPYEIVTGGVAGIGAIIYYTTHFPISYTYFLINGVLLIVGLKILGWKFLTKTIYAILMLTFPWDWHRKSSLRTRRATSSRYWARGRTSCRWSSAV